MLGRRPYDECIDWVADLLDDAATRLPATRNSSDYGRATSVIAKSLKSTNVALCRLTIIQRES
ncbi:hypothetical protein NXV57_23015 [Bacteroides thetaiotaomicron]|nr:hypothetical protein [Bacteroides thetaiotaomicron]